MACRGRVLSIFHEPHPSIGFRQLLKPAAIYTLLSGREKLGAPPAQWRRRLSEGVPAREVMNTGVPHVAPVRVVLDATEGGDLGFRV